jgi:hypothetical protein
MSLLFFLNFYSYAQIIERLDSVFGVYYNYPFWNTIDSSLDEHAINYKNNRIDLIEASKFYTGWNDTTYRKIMFDHQDQKTIINLLFTNFEGVEDTIKREIQSFDEEGRLRDKIDYLKKDSGMIPNQQILYKYNNDSFLSQKIIIDLKDEQQGDTSIIYSYFYNSDGKIDSITAFYHKGNLNRKIDYEYNDGGEVFRKWHVDKRNSGIDTSDYWEYQYFKDIRVERFIARTHFGLIILREKVIKTRKTPWSMVQHPMHFLNPYDDNSPFTKNSYEQVKTKNYSWTFKAIQLTSIENYYYSLRSPVIESKSDLAEMVYYQNLKTLVIENLKKHGTLRIFNSIGQELVFYGQLHDNKTINLANIPLGIYFAVLQTEEGRQTLKIRL